MTDQFHRILMRVQKPARYVGGEYNQIIKDKKDVDVRVAFCFPDTYEIGMSNIGMRNGKPGSKAVSICSAQWSRPSQAPICRKF